MKEQDKLTGNDYLWSASGEPDAEIQRLENALARFRHSRPAPVWPQFDLATCTTHWWSEFALSLRTLRFAAATFVALAIAAALWLSQSPSLPPATRNAWEVELSAAGSASTRADSITKRKIHLEVGAALETDAISKASVTVAEIGHLDVEP